MKFKDLSGVKFGRLRVRCIEPDYKQSANTYWRCDCDCGGEKVVFGPSLTRGSTKSCGCLRKERNKELKNGTKHGLRKTRIYSTWSAMIQRCCNENSRAYKDYGGRGITVCDEWRLSIETFHGWAVNNGYKENLTIERIENNGNYCPSNCKWIPMKDQLRNQRTSKRLTYKNQTKIAADWGRELGIPASTICARKRSGWSDERALSQPVRKGKAIEVSL
jgi:hypothetical protein